MYKSRHRHASAAIQHVFLHANRLGMDFQSASSALVVADSMPLAQRRARQRQDGEPVIWGGRDCRSHGAARLHSFGLACSEI